MHLLDKTIIPKFFTEINATKLVSAKRTGIDKLTFVCKFSMKSRKKVTWHLNNFTIEGYPHFKVTNRYNRKQKLLVSTLKIVSLSNMYVIYFN